YRPGAVWPNNRIPVEYDANVSQANQAVFNSVLAQWSDQCWVVFAPHNNESAYLHVMGDSSICGFAFATSAAYTGGPVEIHVSQGTPMCTTTGWTSFWTLVHEVGHVMGYEHEQGRIDRNTFVQINANNISNGNADQFDIYNSQRTYGPYDFDSIMHYG